MSTIYRTKNTDNTKKKKRQKIMEVQKNTIYIIKFTFISRLKSKVKKTPCSHFRSIPTQTLESAVNPSYHGPKQRVNVSSTFVIVMRSFHILYDICSCLIVYIIIIIIFVCEDVPWVIVNISWFYKIYIQFKTNDDVPLVVQTLLS